MSVLRRGADKRQRWQGKDGAGNFVYDGKMVIFHGMRKRKPTAYQA